MKLIIFLFFCLTSKIGAADQEYQQIDLYAETSFLKENKKLVSEFCLKVKDRYSADDSATPILKLSRLIERLLY